MEAIPGSRLFAIGTEDTILVSLFIATLLYSLVKSRVGPSKHERSQLEELFSIPQEASYQALALSLQASSQDSSDDVNVGST